LKKQNKTRPDRQGERLLALAALAIIVLAWIGGTFRTEADLLPFLKRVLPKADHIESLPGGTYAAWDDLNKTHFLGYISVGSAPGYGGELKMVVAVSPKGEVIGLEILGHKETVAFFRRVKRSGFLDALKGKTYSDPFKIGRDLDGVTGATYSARAVAEAVGKASRNISSRNLGLPVPQDPSPKIIFGLPEFVLIFLFMMGLIGRRRSFKYPKIARWFSLLTGLVVLGFLFDKPLTIVLINKMLLGFWPEWQLHLYWYILLAGILFITIMDLRNPYCDWFCPFGSAQECLAALGGAKRGFPKNIQPFLRWFQRALALGAIVVALFYRNPGLSSYEVFGAFFQLIGTNFQFILLGIVLVAALFIRKPWCGALCPLRPVIDFVRLIRNWIGEKLFGS